MSTVGEKSTTRLTFFWPVPPAFHSKSTVLLLLLLLLMMMPKGDWHPPSAAGPEPPPKDKVGFDAHAELLCAFAQLFHRAIMGRKADKPKLV